MLGIFGSKESNLVVASRLKYTGTVVKTDKGFSFIRGIKRGTESINTNGDVFVPGEFLPGEVVEFDALSIDHQRTEKEGRKLFRAEIATVVSSDNVPAVINMSPSEIVLYANEQKNSYHANAKAIDPEKVRIAAKNQPFAEVIDEVKRIVRDSSAEESMKIEILAEDFMRRTFANMASVDVSYSITEKIDSAKELKAVAKFAEEYELNGLRMQKKNVLDEYGYFSGVREVFHLMHKEGILKMDTVLPISCLPDLTVMTPVWFIGGKRYGNWRQYLCNQIRSENFDMFFWLYNWNNNRAIGDFDSRRDIMPVPIMRLLGKAANVFDIVAITTPYHDLVRWGPNWGRNIDPFLIGIVRDLPLVFILGRWSGTGLFPMMCDMIADTMDHLRSNLPKIAQIEEANFYNSVDQSRGTFFTKNGKMVQAFAVTMLKAYEEGKLFEFLRGEKADAGAVVTA